MFSTNAWVIALTALLGGVCFAGLAYWVVSAFKSTSFVLEHIIPFTPVVVTPSVLVKKTGSYTIIPNFPLYDYYVCESVPPESAKSSFNSSAVVEFTGYRRSFTYYLRPYLSYTTTVSFNHSDLRTLERQGTLDRFLLIYRQTPYSFSTWDSAIFDSEAAGSSPGAKSQPYYPKEYTETRPLWDLPPTITDEACVFTLPPEFNSDCWPGHLCSVEIHLPESPHDDFSVFPTRSVRAVVSVSGKEPDVSQCRPLPGNKREREDLPAELRRRTDLYNINLQYTILAQVGFLVGVCSDVPQYEVYGRLWGAGNENSLSIEASGSITSVDSIVLVVLLSLAFSLLLAFLLFFLFFDAPVPASARVVNGLIRASQEREGRSEHGQG